MRVELTNGAWAELKDPADLRNSDRKAVNKAIRVNIDENDRPIFAASIVDDMKEALLRRIITQWSFLLDLPSRTPDALDLLSIEDYDLLSEAVEPHMAKINGKDGPANEDPESDPTADAGS